MSTTTPAPIAPAADGIGSSRLPARHPVTRLAGPVALVVGSVLAALGMALHIEAMPEDVGLAIAIAEDPQWLATHLLLGFGFALVAVGVASALPVVRGRGSTLAAVGAIATLLGAVLMSLSDIAHGAVGFALGQIDPATSFEVHQVYFGHPAILGLNTGPMLITVGMILLGAGLLRSRAVPRWAGIVVLLTPIAVHVGFNLQLPYVHGAPFPVGMTVLAREIARR